MVLNSKGYFFSLDALIALIIVFSVVLLVRPPTSSLHNDLRVQDDLIKSLGTVHMYELNHSYAQLLLVNGSVTNSNLSVLEQIGEFYARGDSQGKALAQAIINDMHFEDDIALYYGSTLIANSSVVNFSSAREIKTSREIISGIGGGVNASSGYSSRAFLYSENKIKYFYFGGYVGDGNISVSLGDTVVNALIEADFSGDFDLYINDVFISHYSPTPGVPYAINLINASGNFSLSSNTISFRSDEDLAISGGYIKVTYNDSSFDAFDIFLPGITGFINLYDGFYIPGNLTSMEVFLHYESPYNIFLDLGGERVYVGNSSLSDASVTLSDVNLTSYLDYATLSQKTVPLRIGIQNISLIEGLGVDADVFSVTDLSGSMDGSKMSSAKEANELLISILLNNTNNTVGLVGYEDGARDADFHALSRDSSSLSNVIQNVWDADGYTCICCGINKAIEAFITNSSPTDNSLVAYYPFDSDVLDYSGNGLDGTIYGSPSYTVGVSGDGLLFHGNTGNNDYVRISNDDLIGASGMDELTFSMWIYPYDDSQYWQLGGTTDDWNGDGYNMYLRGGQTNQEYSFSIDVSGGGDYTRGGNIAINRWHHLAGVYDGDTMYLYLDGLVIGTDGSKDGPINTNENDLTLGRILGYSGDYFYGIMDEVRIYNYALNSTEIIALNDTSASCGNGLVEVGELCDSNTRVCSVSGDFGTQTCSGSCTSYGACNTAAVCGNGVVNSGEQCDDGNLINNDGCDSVCQIEERYESMIVMSDGDANVQCSEQGTGNAKNDAIQAACDAYNLYGIEVYAVGFGSGADETTLQDIASCGNGDYHFGDVDDLVDIYRQISEDILKASYSLQTLIGEGTSNVLFPDSKISFTYNTSLPYGMVLTSESATFENTIAQGNFTFPSDATPYNIGVVSYSGPLWTYLVEVYDSVTGLWSPVFNLSNYTTDFTTIGDPYIINIPPSNINEGENRIRVSTATNATNVSGGSPYNKIIYSLVKDIASYSEVLPVASGCIWHIGFEDLTNTTMYFPSSYSGSDHCYFAGDDFFFAGDNVAVANENDAVSQAVLNLLLSLDLNDNNFIDIKFTEDDLTLDSVEIEGLPFTWETEVQLRAWR